MPRGDTAARRLRAPAGTGLAQLLVELGLAGTGAPPGAARGGRAPIMPRPTLYDSLEPYFIYGTRSNSSQRSWGMKSGPRPGAEIEYLNVEGAWVSLGTAADMAEAWRLVVGLVLFQYFRK